MTNTTMTITSAFASDPNSYFPNHPHHTHTSRKDNDSLTGLSVEQVLILDHVAMLLQLLKNPSLHSVDPQDTNHADMDNVDDRNIVARINGLLECYGRY